MVVRLGGGGGGGEDGDEDLGRRIRFWGGEGREEGEEGGVPRL